MSQKGKYFACIVIAAIVITAAITSISGSNKSTVVGATEKMATRTMHAEEISMPLRLTEGHIIDLNKFVELEIAEVEKPAMLEAMNEASIKKEDLSQKFPFETESLGTMNIVAHSKKVNKAGSNNINNMTVTINPSIVPYGQIVYIEKLGFRYNQPSDFSDTSSNVYVYFKDESNISDWDGKTLKVYIVHNQANIDFTSQDLISTVHKGNFKMTAYCPCTKCCDQYGASPENKLGAIGANVYEGVTVASDPSILPYGSVVYIEGVGIRFVNDCGGAIKRNRIDVYFYQHNSAQQFGVAYGNVYILQ